ncbi:hypothetical protein MMC2321_03072 [Chitinophaga sp. MM2321]
MEPIWSKFDNELTAIYSNYLHLKETGRVPGQWIHPVLRQGATDIFLTLQYTGDLDAIAAAGFSIRSREGAGVANGMVRFDQLPDLSNHPDVVKLVYGTRKKSSIDTSVLEIMARGTTAGTDCVWSVVQATGVYAGMTGDGVIVGIIDTGIDIRHEAFLKENSSQTRILRIWDQGMTPIAGEHSPAAALLTPPGATTYGVEYDDAAINHALSSPSFSHTVRTRDCAGHGTHVAGIAAGNGKQKQNHSSPRFEFSGVAPKASLVVVKLLSPEVEPAGTNWLQRFKDAISYVLNVAGDKPVVINCSFGSDTGPHDGLVDDGTAIGEESFLENTFAAATGKIAVFSAGNSSFGRQHAIITMPAGGTIDVPFEFYDNRTVRQVYDTCTMVSNTEDEDLNFWYRDTVAGLKVALKVPGAAAFKPSPGAALNAAAFTQTYDTNKTFTIKHSPTNVLRNGSPLERRHININITPHADMHRTGVYTVRLTGPAGAEIHVWCGQGDGFGFQLDPSITTAAPINVTDLNTVGSPGGTPSVITVAAYDDNNDHMACFSSHGPLVDYSGAGVLAAKPDLAAPGFQIFSAASYNIAPEPMATASFVTRKNGGGYVAMSGTSMASPHIAGVVALMLQKKPHQTVADIKLALRNTIRTRPMEFPLTETCPPSNPLTPTSVAPVEEGGAGKVNAKEAWKIIVP